MHLVLSKEWTINCSPFFKSSPSLCVKEVYDSLRTIVRWTPLTGSRLRIKPHHVTLRTKHYQHRGTLWHVKTQIKSIEHKKPCNAFVRSILQLLSAPNGTKAVLISRVIPHVLNNATLWGIIKMQQILFQRSLCILLFFPFSCTTTYSTAIPASSGISAVDQSRVFEKQILQWDRILPKEVIKWLCHTESTRMLIGLCRSHRFNLK